MRAPARHARPSEAVEPRDLPPPAGYSLDWGGQFENQERATRRLIVLLPLSILITFTLLFITFDSAPYALLILLNVPFAMVGGVAALWVRGLNLNLSASTGFVALFGVAVRLRSVLMTALVASLGFLPVTLSTSPGAEVQRPLATVVIGLVSATGLTLFLLPLIYPWFSSKDL